MARTKPPPAHGPNHVAVSSAGLPRTVCMLRYVSFLPLVLSTKDLLEISIEEENRESTPGQEQGQQQALQVLDVKDLGGNQRRGSPPPLHVDSCSKQENASYQGDDNLR